MKLKILFYLTFLFVFKIITSKTIDQNQSSQKFTVLDSFEIQIQNKTELFPDHFNLTFMHSGTLNQRRFLRRKFIKTNSAEIYTLDRETSQPVRYNQKSQDGEDYDMEGGKGYARLIQDQDDKNSFKVV
ncbi:hypothetical protein BpHYR1_004193, partial [Brachionus plicatilis]